MENSDAIEFLYEDIEFRLEEQTALRAWVLQVILTHQFRLESITFIFCSDLYLNKINREFLDHDGFTDIITFDNSDDSEVIEGDIFISVERVRENAQTFNVPFREELHRVLIHGVLHLLGHKDKELLSRTAMRHREDLSLSLRQF